MKAIPYKFLFCTEQFFWSFFSMIKLKNTSLWRPQSNGFLLTICWFIAKLAHPLYLTTDNETRHYMQFSLKSSLCRFIRKSFVGIFKMNTDSCFCHPCDGTSCHWTLEDLASWTRRPRFSGRRPQGLPVPTNWGPPPGVEHWISRSRKEKYISNEYPLLGMLFWALPFMRTFLTKKTLLSVLLEKNNFFEPNLEPIRFSEYFFSALFWKLFSLTTFWMAFLSTFLNMFVHLRIIFLGNAFLSKNTILSSSLSNITFLSVFLSTFLRAFSVERFLSALLSTFLSVFFVEHFFECFFEHYKHNSRYFRTLLSLFVESRLYAPEIITYLNKSS